LPRLLASATILAARLTYWTDLEETERKLTSIQSQQAPSSHGPLDGVKVLDLSEDIAGSFCGRLLADYGADVLKLEPPTGASLRRMGPFFGDDPHPEKSLFYLLMNLN